MKTGEGGEVLRAKPRDRSQYPDLSGRTRVRHFLQGLLLKKGRPRSCPACDPGGSPHVREGSNITRGALLDSRDPAPPADILKENNGC